MVLGQSEQYQQMSYREKNADESNKVMLESEVFPESNMLIGKSFLGKGYTPKTKTTITV